MVLWSQSKVLQKNWTCSVGGKFGYVDLLWTLGDIYYRFKVGGDLYHCVHPCSTILVFTPQCYTRLIVMVYLHQHRTLRCLSCCHILRLQVYQIECSRSKRCWKYCLMFHRKCDVQARTESQFIMTTYICWLAYSVEFRIFYEVILVSHVQYQ